MRKIVLIAIMVMVLFTGASSVSGGETNISLLPRKLWVIEPTLPPLWRLTDFTNDCTLKFQNYECSKPEKDFLPLQSRMNFATLRISPTQAEDTFDLKLFDLYARKDVSVVVFVDSWYGISMTGLDKERLGVGFGITKKLGRRH